MFPDHPARIVTTIEARMTSSRLPGKVLLPLAGLPALQWMIERVRLSRYVDDVVVATTVNAGDDPIEELCSRIGCRVHRGSEDDVLMRVLEAASGADADLIVELTGDCPLIDPAHIDRTLACFFESPCDYASNILTRTLPDGFDVQVFPTDVLAQVERLTQDPLDRVHVSYYIYRHPERFRLRGWVVEDELHWPDLRLTLDESADYELIRRVVEHFAPHGSGFSALEMVRYLRAHPELRALNAQVRTKDVSEG